MPYDVPHPMTDVRLLTEKIGWVERTAHVDMALYGTIRKRDAIAPLAAAGVSAFKLSTYEYDPVRFPRIDPSTMVAALGEIAKTGLPVAIHNEKPGTDRGAGGRRAPQRKDGADRPLSNPPPLAETMADLEIFEIGLATGAHVHIAHSSLARGFDIALNFRALGATATGETCIQHLCMDETDYRASRWHRQMQSTTPRPSRGRAAVAGAG